VFIKKLLLFGKYPCQTKILFIKVSTWEADFNIFDILLKNVLKLMSEILIGKPL